MATRSLKRGAVREIDFKEKGDFRQKLWAVSPFGDFSPKQKKLPGSELKSEELSLSPEINFHLSLLTATVALSLCTITMTLYIGERSISRPFRIFNYNSTY